MKGRKPFWAFLLGWPTKEDSSSSVLWNVAVILAGLGCTGLGVYYRWVAEHSFVNREGGMIALFVGLAVTFGNLFGSYHAWKTIKPSA